MYVDIPTVAWFTGTEYVEALGVVVTELDLGLLNDEETFVVAYTLNRVFVEDGVALDEFTIGAESAVRGIVPGGVLGLVTATAEYILIQLRK
jgi:hypothetical protein